MLSWRPVAVALVLALACAIALPAYSGPDELAHVAYAAAVAHGHLPVLPNGEFANIATGTTWQAQHPPLFYLLAAPLYLAAGGNTTTVLYLMRLLSIVGLIATIILIDRVARLLLPPDRAGLAAWIVAAHPTVVYVSSMVNNEAWAMAFAVACVWAALKSRQSADLRQSAITRGFSADYADHAERGGRKPAAANPESAANNQQHLPTVEAALDRAATDQEPGTTNQELKWLIAAAVLGGLGLLTKLTAIAGVAGAAVILVQTAASRTGTSSQEPGATNRLPATRSQEPGTGNRMLRGAAVLAGAIALWLPWGLLMKRLYGTFVPSPIQRPAFTGGLMALTIFPQGAAIFIGVGVAEFAIGLLTPYWLMEPIKNAHAAMIVVGWLVVIAVCALAYRCRELRFTLAAFFTLLLLVLNHILFRDGYAIIFLARYSPIAAVLAALLVASAVGGLKPRARAAALAVMGFIAASGFGYVAWFYTIGPSNDAAWRKHPEIIRGPSPDAAASGASDRPNP